MIGESAAINVNDAFHLGSVTKPITATLLARLIENENLAGTAHRSRCFQDGIPNGTGVENYHIVTNPVASGWRRTLH
jgi:hypothetical protein